MTRHYIRITHRYTHKNLDFINNIRVASKRSARDLMWHLNHTPRRLFFFFHARFLLHGSKNSYLHIYCSGWGITLMGIWFYCSSIELPLAREGRSNRMEPTLIYFGEPRWMLKHERFSHHALPTTRPQTWNIIRGSSVRQGRFKQIVNSISPPPRRYQALDDKSVLNCEIHTNTRQFFLSIEFHFFQDFRLE